jgi:hypothetical protein
MFRVSLLRPATKAHVPYSSSIDVPLDDNRWGYIKVMHRSPLALPTRELKEHPLPYCEKVIAIFDDQKRASNLPSRVRSCPPLSVAPNLDDQHRVCRNAQL